MALGAVLLLHSEYQHHLLDNDHTIKCPWSPFLALCGTSHVPKLYKTHSRGILKVQEFRTVR